MNKLTAEKCREMLTHFKSLNIQGYLLEEGKQILQALEIALPVLEQQAETAKPIECPFPCGWKELLRISMSDGAFLARDLLEGVEVKDLHRHAALSNTDRLVKVITVILNAQEVKSPPQPTTDTYRQIENDGWIEWGGGKQPVSNSTLVEVKLQRDGYQGEDNAMTWDWTWRDGVDPIIAYRVIENDGRQ